MSNYDDCQPKAKTRGVYLAQKRIKRGMSVNELAKEVGVSPSTIKNIEAGNNEVKASVLYILSNIYGVSMNDLWTGGKLPLEYENQNAKTIAELKELAVKFNNKLDTLG